MKKIKLATHVCQSIETYLTKQMEIEKMLSLAAKSATTSRLKETKEGMNFQLNSLKELVSFSFCCLNSRKIESLTRTRNFILNSIG